MSNHAELLHGELLRVPPSFYSDVVVTSEHTEKEQNSCTKQASSLKMKSSQYGENS